MKKTLTVNLGGTVYHIDEDAYRLLDNYLNNLRLFFRRQEGGEEIVNDMEGRIAELFSEKLSLARSQVITIADVEEVIERMGHPEQLAGEQPAQEEKSESKRSPGETKGSYTRRLYRDPDNKLLGGVVGGLAAYCGMDPTLLRIIILLVMFFSQGSFLLIYIILWIVIPEARTAEQKLHMRGEDITLENIGKTVTDGFNKTVEDTNEFIRSEKPRNFFLKLGDVFLAIVGLMAKVFLVFMAIILSPVLFALAVAFIALLIAAIGILVTGSSVMVGLLPVWDWVAVSEAPIMALVGSLCGILLVGIPIGGLAFAILRHFFSWRPMATGLKWTLIILWFIALIVMTICAVETGWQYFPEFYEWTALSF